MDLKINERWVSVTTWINGKMGGKIKSAQNRWEEKIAVSFFPFSLIVKNFLSASGGKKNGRWVGGTPSDSLFPQGWCRRIREESSIAFLIPLPGNSGSTGSVTGNTGEHVVLSAPLKIRCKTSEEGEWLSSPSAEIRLYNRLWCSAPWSDKQFWVQQLKSKKKKKSHGIITAAELRTGLEGNSSSQSFNLKVRTGWERRNGTVTRTRTFHEDSDR